MIKKNKYAQRNTNIVRNIKGIVSFATHFEQPAPIKQPRYAQQQAIKKQQKQIQQSIPTKIVYVPVAVPQPQPVQQSQGYASDSSFQIPAHLLDPNEKNLSIENPNYRSPFDQFKDRYHLQKCLVTFKSGNSKQSIVGILHVGKVQIQMSIGGTLFSVPFIDVVAVQKWKTN